MAHTLLLADLERAFDLLKPLDESKLDFAPDPNVSPGIRELTSLATYPTVSHLANLQARIDAVVKAGISWARASLPTMCRSSSSRV